MYASLYGENFEIDNYDEYTFIPGIQFFESETSYDNISKITIANSYFRKVIDTSPHHQIVLMSLLPFEEIGEETHSDTDQFFRIEQGKGVAIINDVRFPLETDMFINVPQGTKHNIINTGSTELKLYTIYSPPHHPPGLVQPAKLPN